MDQVHRVLSIYTKLIQHKIVNKEALSNEWKVTTRTLQRDIDNIRNFLYDTDEWHGFRKEINYNHQLHSYEMDSSISDNEKALYFLLILLETVTPEIDERLYKYLELLVESSHVQYENELRIQLSKLISVKSNTQLDNILLVNQAIQYSQMLYKDSNEEIIPMSIRYDNFTFKLMYKANDCIQSTNLNNKAVNLSPNHFDKQSLNDTLHWITIELTPEVFPLIHNKYPYEVVKEACDGYCVIRVKMCVEDAVNFCFLAREQARLLGPDNVYQMVMKALLKFQETYLLPR